MNFTSGVIFRTDAEARQELQQMVPELSRGEWKITSPFDTRYQCIAWAACRTDRFWWPWDSPMCYWPPGFPKYTVGTPVSAQYFADVFEKRFGYRQCQTPAFEFGYQKVAIYANALGATHMARQHLWGKGWLSKLGVWEDVVHSEPTHVCGSIDPLAGEYGVVALYMKRPWWRAVATLCIFRLLKQAIRLQMIRWLLGRPEQS